MRLSFVIPLFLLIFAQTATANIHLKCMVCHWGADILVHYARRGSGAEGEFIQAVAKMCHWLRIQSKEVCDEMVTKVGVQLFDILVESEGEVSSYDICGMIQEGECAKYSMQIQFPCQYYKTTL